MFKNIHVLYLLLLVAGAAAFSQSCEKKQDSLSVLWPKSTVISHQLFLKGVPNFGKLNQYIWRSGQPSREGYQRLAEMGLKTVVNLRAEYPQDADLLPKDINYISIPVKDRHAPTPEQADRFLKLVAQPENWPLLVHCRAGKGRTGIMSALVRHSFDGWCQDSIDAEIHNFLFSQNRLWFLNFAMPITPSQTRFIANYEKKNAAGGYLKISETAP